MRIFSFRKIFENLKYEIPSMYIFPLLLLLFVLHTGVFWSKMKDFPRAENVGKMGFFFLYRWLNIIIFINKKIKSWFSNQISSFVAFLHAKEPKSTFSGPYSISKSQMKKNDRPAPWSHHALKMVLLRENLVGISTKKSCKISSKNWTY